MYDGDYEPLCSDNNSVCVGDEICINYYEEYLPNSIDSSYLWYGMVVY